MSGLPIYRRNVKNVEAFHSVRSTSSTIVSLVPFATKGRKREGEKPRLPVPFLFPSSSMLTSHRCFLFHHLLSFCSPNSPWFSRLDCCGRKRVVKRSWITMTPPVFDRFEWKMVKMVGFRIRKGLEKINSDPVERASRMISRNNYWKEWWNDY